MKFIQWPIYIKYLSLLFLFVFFVCEFGYPSCKKYWTAGVMVDTSWVHRTSQDFPSITFCALNNMTMEGWKNEEKNDLNRFSSPFDTYCNSTTEVTHLMGCIGNKTFTLKDTIKSDIEDKTLWTQDLFDADHGRVFRFKQITLKYHKAHTLKGELAFFSKYTLYRKYTASRVVTI